MDALVKYAYYFAVVGTWVPCALVWAWFFREYWRTKTWYATAIRSKGTIVDWRERVYPSFDLRMRIKTLVGGVFVIALIFLFQFCYPSIAHNYQSYFEIGIFIIVFATIALLRWKLNRQSAFKVIYSPTVEFRAQDGSLHKIWATAGRSAKPDPPLDGSMQVLYPPDHPDQAVVDAFDMRPARIGLAILPLVITGLCYYVWTMIASNFALYY
jgi:hypothetical protein